MPDQFRGDCMSIAGHPVLETPAIDSIGDRGTFFEAAYTTCASCVPARRSLLTGLYPSSNGMVGMKGGYAIPEQTMPQILSRNGYRTVMCGRYMHQSPYEEPYGFERRVLASTHVSDDEYAAALRDRVPGLESLRDALRENRGITFNGWGAGPWEYGDDIHPTAWVTRRARELTAEHTGDRPLFLMTSFYAPHPPLVPPAEYFDRFLDQQLPEPARGDWVGESPGNADEVSMDSQRVHLDGEALQRAQAGYFGLIKHIDDQIAPLMEEFKEKSEAAGRPWIIAFFSDHGEMMGDHNYFRKCEPYEGSSHIPLLIQGSDDLGWRKLQRSRTPVCLEDIMPTVLEAAGIRVPEGLDGQSLIPVLEGKKERVRETLHLEHARCYSLEQEHQTLTDGRLKYIWRPLDGSEQLFDLERDPRELHDLSGNPEYRETIEQWRNLMIDQLRDRPEGFTDGSRLIPGREYEAPLPFLENHKTTD